MAKSLGDILGEVEDGPVASDGHTGPFDIFKENPAATISNKYSSNGVTLVDVYFEDEDEGRSDGPYTYIYES